jgi:hypothetical protein
MYFCDFDCVDDDKFTRGNAMTLREINYLCGGMFLGALLGICMAVAWFGVIP